MKKGHVETMSKTILRRFYLIILNYVIKPSSLTTISVEVEGRLERGQKLVDIKEIGATCEGNFGHPVVKGTRCTLQ